MTKNITALMARTQFGQVLERVSRGEERFMVTKNGEAKAVIVGLKEFFRFASETPESLSVLQKEARKSGASALSLEDIEQEIQKVRRLKTSKKKYASKGRV